MQWHRFSPKLFKKKLFLTALIIRVVYVIFIYFYYISMTGEPYMLYSSDELGYHNIAMLLREDGWETFNRYVKTYGLSDRGYFYWLGMIYAVFGNNILAGRLMKCFLDSFSCLFIYSVAKRNFGEFTGRIAAIFYMMMPSMWYYCGITLKETDMVFLILLFVERADLVMHSKKITVVSLLLPGLIILALFAFRTALAAVLVAALVGAIVFSSGKQLELWKKILYASIFGVWMIMTVGVEIIEETEALWVGRSQNQEAGYEWRAETNSYAKYASATLFAPAIFTIPFSTMVAIPGQENQMILHGANFTKNIMSGFTIFALFVLLFSGEWRKHVLPIAVMCGYLLVLVFSNFAHSERFHFPVLGLELMFAAYGISQVKNKQKRWFTLWLIFVCLVNIGWAYIKLAGRGMS
jgi:4-amino-4-deoxy-L-arabinose transferase-like glycosyltransferase